VLAHAPALSALLNPTANPYLAMAAVGAAVYLGIGDKTERFERYVTDWEFREYAYHL
jgi:glutamine synthetase